MIQINTLTSTWPKLPAKRKRDYVFVLDELELAFPKEQLHRITMHWNNGMELEAISKKENRVVEEVFLALFHQSLLDKTTRPFAYRKIGVEHAE